MGTLVSASLWLQSSRVVNGQFQRSGQPRVPRRIAERNYWRSYASLVMSPVLLQSKLRLVRRLRNCYVMSWTALRCTRARLF